MYLHEPSLLHLWRVKSQHQGNHCGIHHHPLSSPLMASAQGSDATTPPLPLGFTHSSTGFLFLFVVDFAHEVRFSPLTPHFLSTSLWFYTVGILLSSFTVGAEVSKPIAKYLSISATWSCQGTLQFVTSAARPRFAFGQLLAAVTLVGRLKRLDCLPLPVLHPPSSWSSSCCSVTATPFPLSPPQLAPYCFPFHG